jgi:hypothetical protein
MVAVLDAASLHVNFAEAGRIRLCLLSRFGHAAPSLGIGATMSTSRLFLAGHPESFNPLALIAGDPVTIDRGWMNVRIVDIDADGLHLTLRQDGDTSTASGQEASLRMELTPASQLRTIHGTAVAVSMLRPDDQAEVGYHYRDGVRQVDWLRPFEKEVRGTVTSMDRVHARVGVRTPDGIERFAIIPATASRESYDHLALADCSTIHAGDTLTFWYVGPVDAPVVERIDAHHAVPLRAAVLAHATPPAVGPVGTLP